VKILFLATDAFGGRGGIAHYNRCLATALASCLGINQITLVPRVIADRNALELAALPSAIQLVSWAAQGAIRYVLATLRQLFGGHDLVICGHIHLLPLAALMAVAGRIPLVLQVHGIEAWHRPQVRFLTWAMKQVSAVWSVSRVTRDCMNAWAGLPLSRYTVIPNTINLENYGVAPKRLDLLSRFGLEGRKVVLTLGRLDSRERYKGMDEIIEVLPSFRQAVPEIVYLIGGAGDDQSRLVEKARRLGVDDIVVFAGFVEEEEKADFLRLADVFAMPGRGEGFGIVYLEAMACGVPVVGSLLDGSQDALQDGKLGVLVDPTDADQLLAGLLKALATPRGVPSGLADFRWSSFVRRVSEAIEPCKRVPT
jgi:phosphatidylinositol alpha-1,6-mannosyltransferase